MKTAGRFFLFIGIPVLMFGAIIFTAAPYPAPIQHMVLVGKVIAIGLELIVYGVYAFLIKT